MGPNAPAYVTRLAESTNHAKYGDLCTARGIQHLPAVFNAYRGWGEEILEKLVERGDSLDFSSTWPMARPLWTPYF